MDDDVPPGFNASTEDVPPGFTAKMGGAGSGGGSTAESAAGTAENGAPSKLSEGLAAHLKQSAKVRARPSCTACPVATGNAAHWPVQGCVADGCTSRRRQTAAWEQVALANAFVRACTPTYSSLANSRKYGVLSSGGAL